MSFVVDSMELEGLASTMPRKLRLLMIALEFAPAQSTGIFRSLRFVSRFHKHNIEPVVVTIDPADACSLFGVPNNPELLKGIPEGTEIHHLAFAGKAKSSNKLVEFVRHWTRVADGFHAGLCESFKRLLDSGALGQIDAIYVSLPPFGAGELALDAKQKLNKPLIVDMRDAWSQWGASSFTSYLHYRVVRALESKLLNAADSVVSVTSQLQRMLQSLVPPAKHARFFCVPNASDETSFPTTISWNGEGKSTIDVGYVGSFYFNEAAHRLQSLPWYKRPVHNWPNYYATTQDWLYRTPNFFFQAWNEIAKSWPDIAGRIRFHLIGNTPEWLPSMAENWGVKNQCVFHGRVLKQEVANVLASIDFLLATSVKVRDGEDYCLASKSFEYIASGKPTLGFVCHGSQKDFIQQSQTGFVVDPDNPADAAAKFVQVINEGVSLKPNHEFLANFDADVTCEKIANMILKVAHSRAEGQ